MSTICNNS
uniref:Uncharacterized protein n=1 Tax=Romanomermis culicivorax TaxID=13658 RepID=A0A915JN40_ROMCU